MVVYLCLRDQWGNVHNLFISTFLRNSHIKNIHKTTKVSPDNRTENQIDHICISAEFIRSLLDVRAMRRTDAASDHFLVVGKLKVRLKKMCAK